MGSKYIIGGIPLDVYCKKHELNFRTQSNRVRDYIKKHPELNEQDAIKLAISRCGVHPGTKYIYGNVSLAEWCRQNDKSYDCMISRVERIKTSFPDIDDNEATRIAIEDFSDKGIKYFYDGIPLVEYCKLHPEYLYSTVSLYIRRTKEKNPNLSDQEIIDFYFETEHTTHAYHFINDVSLMEYCDNHDILYNSIIQALSRMRKNEKYKNLSEQERLNIAITYYERKKRLNNINKIFDYLRNEKNIDEKILKEILLYLKIDFQNVLFLMDKFSNILDIIYFIWYFHDSNSEGLIMVSEIRVKEIMLSIKSLPSLPIVEEKILKMDLGYLIGIYKANLFDTRYLIILHQEKLHYRILLGLMSYYSLNLSEEDKKDIINDANLYLLELVEKNNNNNIAMVISYLNKSIKGFILNKVLFFTREQGTISLYSPIFKNRDSKNAKLLIDKIPDKKNDNPFSDEIQEIICSLDSKSQSFIYYKFYECLSNEEISSILNIDLDELDAFEKCLLGKLSENESLKKLVKK